MGEIATRLKTTAQEEDFSRRVVDADLLRKRQRGKQVPTSAAGADPNFLLLHTFYKLDKSPPCYSNALFFDIGSRSRLPSHHVPLPDS